MNNCSVFRFRSVLPALCAVSALGMVPGHAQAQMDVDQDTLKETAAAAIELIERDGVSAALPILEEPPFFDRATGLHVWAMDGDAVVILDASGQTETGNDLSMLSLDGETLIPDAIGDAIAADEVVVWHDLVPHAVTEVLATSHMWCTESTDVEGYDAFLLCAMAWFDEE